MPRHLKSRLAGRAATLLTALSTAMLTPQLTQAQYRWLGGGTDNNWGNTTNWQNGLIPPTFNGNDITHVVMQGSGGTSDLADFINNDDDWGIDSLTFESATTGSYTLIGGALSLTNGFGGTAFNFIRNSDGNKHTFNNSLVGLDIVNSNTFDADIGDLEFDAPVFSGGFSGTTDLTVTGGNDVFFDGGISSNGGLIDLSVTGTGTIAHIRSSASAVNDVTVNTGTTLRIGSSSNLASSTNLLVNGTFDINNFTEDVDQVTGVGTIDLGSGSLTLGDSADFIFNGTIVGTGGITKNQGGVMRLGKVNTYTGATNITAGTLRLNNSTIDGSLSSSTDVNVSSGAVFDLNGVSDTVDSISGAGSILLGGAELVVDATSGTEVFSGNITESGTLRKLGNHALTLSGNNGFTSLIVAGGTLGISSSNNLGASNATLLLANSTLDVNNSLTNSRTIFLDDGIFDVTTGATFTQNGLIRNNVSTADLTKTGSGTMVLGTSNSYTGDTIVNLGRLELNGSNRISNSSDLVLNGGTFDLNNFSDTVGGLSGVLGALVETGGISGRLTVNQSENRTFSGGISGSGGITKQGNGRLTLAGVTTHSGATVIQDGTLQLSGFGSLSSSTDVSVSSGATFDLNGVSDTVDSISGAGNILLGGAQLTVDQSSGTQTFSGVISESGSITKSGNHTLVLSGNNSFNGGVLIFDGAISVGSDSNLGASSGDITLAIDGELQTTSSFTTSRDIAFGMAANGKINTASGTTLTHSGGLSGGTDVILTKRGNGTYRMNAANAGFGGDIVIEDGTFEIASFSGDALGNSTRITVNSGALLLNNQVEGFGSLAGAGNVTTNSTLEVGFDNSSTTYSGVIGSTTSSGFVGKAGTGVMTITQPQTYSQRTEVNGGTLRLSGSGRLPINTDLEVTGVFDLNNADQRIDALTGGGSVLLGGGTLRVGNNNASNATFSGVISESGDVTTGALVKVGSGLQTLTGNNSYSGVTEIVGGTLRVNNPNNLGSGALLISNGARFEVQDTSTNTRIVNLGTGGGKYDVAIFKTVTQTAPIVGVGGLTKEDFGDLLLTASNTYGGDTQISAGGIRLSGGGRLPNSSNVNVGSSGFFDLNGVPDTVATVSGAGNITLGGGTLTVFGNDASPYEFSGVISEAGALNKDGDHTLVLSGNNTFTGPISIFGPSSGALSVSSDVNLGNAANTVTFDEGTLQVTNSFSSPRAMTVTSNGGIIDIVGSQVQLESTGVIAGQGGGEVLTKRGTGRLYLRGNNTYSGGTVIENGSLQIDSNSGLGAASSPLTLATGRLVISDEFTNLHPIVISGSGAIDTTSQTHFVDLPITGVGRLSKFGTGELELNAGAMHQGHTSIEAGTLWTGGGLPNLFDVELADPSATWTMAVDDTIDALIGDGTVRLLGNTLTLGGGDGGDFFEGALQGPGALIKIGPGTQTLAGANSHTATEINEGIMVVSADGNLGAAAAPLAFDDFAWLTTTSTFTLARDVTLNGAGGTLDVNGGTTLTVANPISGQGGLRKRGLGTLVLQANNNFGGPLTVIQGLVQIDTGMTFGGLEGAGSLDLGLNELVVNNTDDELFSGVISGIGGKLTKDGPGTLTLSGINTYTGGTCINGGVLRISQTENLGEVGSLITFDGGTLNTTASFSMIRGMALQSGNGTIDVDSGTLLDASGQVTGMGSLTKLGDGTLQLSGFSTYEGGTDILAGEVSINNNFNLGNSAGPLTLDTGSLHTSNNVATARLTTLGAGGGTFRSDAGTTLTHSGAILGTPGTAGLTKRGAGNVSLAGNNTFTGDIYLEAGRLQVDASNRLGNTGNVVRMRGGTLNTLATMTNGRQIQLEDGPTANTIEVNGGTTLTQNGQITDGPSGPAQTLAKSGGGTLQLTAANTYSSPTQISAGTVRLSGSGQLPDVTDVTIASGGTYDLNNLDDAIDGLSGAGDVVLGSARLTVGANDGGGSFNGLISGSGGLTKVGAGTQLLRTREIGMATFPNTYAGGTAINGGVLDVTSDANLGDAVGNLSFDGGTLRVGADAGVNTMRSVILNVGGGTIDAGEDGSVTFGNVVSGIGSLTKEGLGTLTYGAANTYTGDTIVNRGDLRLDPNGRIADASSLIVNSPGVFDLNGVNDAINGLSGNGAILLGAGRLTVGATGGNGAHSGVISGDGGITKSGSGLQTLSGFNTYLASTHLDGGVLQVALNANLGDAAAGLNFNGGTLRTTGSFIMGRNPTLGAAGGTIDAVAGTTLTTVSPFAGIGGLTKLGGGTVLMNGVSTYTGATQISAGTLQLGGVERLANATDVTVANGATLNLAGFNESIDALDGAGMVALGAASLNVGIDNGSGSFSGIISGTGDLLKQGNGIQTLSGQNTYSGATFIDGGQLILNDGGSINQSTTVVGFNIGSNGTATAAGNGTTWDLSGDLFVGLDGIGRMNISDDAMMTVEGGVTIGSLNQGPASAGTLRLHNGTLDNSTGNGIQVVNGSLQGHGTVLGDVTNLSVVGSGNSAGILEITGDFVQALNGTLVVEIGGADNSNLGMPQFDVLDVNGNLGIDGLINVALLNGFNPAPTDTFTVASANVLAGTFTNAANGERVNLSGGGTGSFQVNYISNSIVLSDFQGMASPGGDFDNNGTLDGADVDALVDAIATGSVNLAFDLTGDGQLDGDDLSEWLIVAGAANLPSGNPYLFGDATLDGAVDGDDFDAWNGNKFTSLAAWTGGDFNADGLVNGRDFLIWNSNRGQSADTVAQVPEPAMSMWIIAAGLLISGLRRGW